MTRADPRIQQAFAELREYIRDPSAYCDFHSTTKDGMIGYTLTVEKRVQAALDEERDAALEEAYCGCYELVSEKISQRAIDEAETIGRCMGVIRALKSAKEKPNV